MAAGVTIYTRKQCGLCDETEEQLHRLRAELHFDLTVLNIDADLLLREEYDAIVPVVTVGERIIAHAPITADELRWALSAALR